jgi:nucleotide-binding universal stress UspA family protein
MNVPGVQAVRAVSGSSLRIASVAAGAILAHVRARRAVRRGPSAPEVSMARSFRRVLVATDFSKSAGLALDWAGRFAQHVGAPLHVLHAWQIPVLVGPAGAYLATADMAGSLERELGTELATLCEGRPVAGRHLVRATPEEAVRKVASEIGADLIAVGTQGGSALAHVLFGSVAERILRTSERPVVLVPRAYEGLAARAELVRRVMVPVELAPESIPTIEDAAALAESFAVPVDVVHVTELPPYLVRHASLAAETERSLEHELAQLTSRAGTGSAKLSTHLLLGRTGAALTERIRSSEADLVVMRTHGRATLERFFLGSVTEHVIRKGGVPVMVLPAPRP